MNILEFIRDLPNVYERYFNELVITYAKYTTFSSISSFDGTLVMIGANGSRKSTFARFFKGNLPRSNVVILAAQHSLNYKDRNNILLRGNELEERYIVFKEWIKCQIIKILNIYINLIWKN